MKLHILGSGSCVVKQERCSSGYLVETEDTLVMVDSGTGTSDMMRRKEVDVDEIDAVFNTHRHPDHISDLIPIVQDKVVRSFSNDESEISLYGPGDYTNYLQSRFQFEMKEDIDNFEDNFGFSVGSGAIEDLEEFKDLKVEVFNADHGPENFRCVSIKLSSNGKQIFFTGDTDYFKALSDNAKGSDILVADCSQPDHNKVEGHMTPEECAKVAQRAQVDKLVLSHLYPAAEKSNIKETAAETFKGDIVVAEDLMEIRF